MAELEGIRVAVLVDDGFEQVEMTEPRKALTQAGAQVQIVSSKPDRVRGWNHTKWGRYFPVDVPLDGARPQDFEALLLPGGVQNPDRLRIQPKAMEFVKAFFDAGKPVAAICHAPWTLIEAKAVQGRRMTSWPSLMTDLNNAGASWVDEPVVRDGALVTSRKPDDIPKFNRAMVDLFGEARARMRRAS